MMTEKSKVHKPRSYTTSYFNEKDTLPSYKDISSRVSTKIDPNFQSDEKHHRKFWKVWEQHEEEYSGKKIMKERLKTDTKR